MAESRVRHDQTVHSPRVTDRWRLPVDGRDILPLNEQQIVEQCALVKAKGFKSVSAPDNNHSLEGKDAEARMHRLFCRESIHLLTTKASTRQPRR